MKAEIDILNGATVEVHTGADALAGHRTCQADRVYLGDFGGEYFPDELSPAQARELAAALLRAADEAEGR
ncbi:hypothetical protein [Streptomyces sennicomposti]